MSNCPSSPILEEVTFLHRPICVPTLKPDSNPFPVSTHKSQQTTKRNPDIFSHLSTSLKWTTASPSLNSQHSCCLSLSVSSPFTVAARTPLAHHCCYKNDVVGALFLPLLQTECTADGVLFLSLLQARRAVAGVLFLSLLHECHRCRLEMPPPLTSLQSYRCAWFSW